MPSGSGTRLAHTGGRALDILTEIGIDRTDDEEANTEAIRAHLAGMSDPAGS